MFRPDRTVLSVLLASVLVSTGLMTASAAPAAADQTFGSTPLDYVLNAASAANRCGLPRDELAAIVLAPTYPETGALAANAAPSPMTLSRWDNKPTKVGPMGDQVDTWPLFAFKDKGTIYRRAFWNPGIGPWQFDSAGLGSPLSAESYISTASAATIATTKMAATWCNTSTNPDPVARRSAVWGPWHGCKSGKCEQIFTDIYDPATQQLRRVARDGSVGESGGMEARSCKLPSTTAAFACWYVDPSRAQGYIGFTTYPEGTFDAQGNPVKTPLSAPFYVYTRDGREHRHWLRPDTGYGQEISASRPLGSNVRTSIVWSDAPQLCDRSYFRGTCDTAPNPKLTSVVSIAGTYQPVVGDFRNVARDDILWFSPSGSDLMWRSTGSGTFLAEGISVSGAFTPIVGDFNGNGYDDIYWYNATLGDALYSGGPGGFTATYPTANGDFTPLVGDFNGDNRDDIYWFSPRGGDAIYYGSPTGFTATYPNANGTFKPMVGDFDGDGIQDIYWFSPTDGDALYYGNPTGFTAVYPNANGPFTPVLANLDAIPGDDIVWYVPGTAGDVYWTSTGNRTSPFTGASTVIHGFYRPISGQFDGSTGKDILWYDASSEPDPLWYG
ncbi:MAG: FG-GAP repeat domain-containing protein [Microthrixaceae bacterium]